jgi:Fur family ferric uptake transcriptional regulator/Fur family peroxide stress response transcriptional regulator
MPPRADLSHRDLILDIVKRTDEHPSADDVFMRARSSVPSISLATVYRNLRRLVNDGRLRERMFGGVSRFDAHLEEHAHLVCTSCGAIVDVAADGAEFVRQLDVAAPAWVLERVDLEVKGLCPNCRKKPEAGRSTRTRRTRARRH